MFSASSSIDKIRTLFFLLLFPFFSSFYAQSTATVDTLLALNFYEKGNDFLGNGEIDSALIYFNQAGVLFESSRRWEDYAYNEMSLAVCHYYLSQFDSSEFHLKQLITATETHAITDEDLWMNTNNLLSILYSVKGDYNQAIKTVRSDISRILSKEERTNYDSSTVANYYNSLGAWYSRKEDYDRALDYLRGTLSFYEKMGVGLEEIALTYENISKVLILKGDYRSSIACSKKLLQLIDASSAGEQDITTRKEAYSSLSSSYRYLEQLDSALYYAEQAMAVAKDYSPILAHINLGQAHLALKQSQQAISFFQHAEDLILSEENVRELYITYTYNGLGNTYLLQEDYEKALSYYQKAFISNVEGFTETNWKKNPSLSGINRADLFLVSTHQKAKAIARLANDQETLELAFSTYQTCIDWIDSMRTNIVSEGAQLFWRNRVREVYGGAIEVAYQLYQVDQEPQYLTQAFAFSEKSKSILLLEERRLSERKRGGIVPDSLVEKEKDLKIDIAFFQKQLSQEKEEEKIKRYQKFLSTSRLELANLKEEIERQYPEVARSKQIDFSKSLNSVKRHLLKEETALIEYFITENGLYAFLITRQKETFIRLADQILFEQKSRAFNQELLNPEAMEVDARKALASYDQAAFELYQIVLAPLLDQLSESCQHLYLVPDGLLHHLPFEVLTRSVLEQASTDFAKLDYLGKDLDLSYAYSANFLIENLHNKATLQANQRCLATAPQYLSEQAIAMRSTEKLTRSELAALEGTAREIKAISAYFSGTFRQGMEATKADFLSQINQYGILHLATHGVADYENPELAHFLFSNTQKGEDQDQLYHYEVANLDLQAQLAVLSACETGQGKYEEGEGVFSLARGFMQAGVPSVVMSLWKVNDLSTSELMPHFYARLSEGLAIGSAMNQAKQNYLADAPLRFRHPYYWSGFVVLGDPHELKGGRSFSLWLAIGGLSVVLLGLWFWKSR